MGFRPLRRKRFKPLFWRKVSNIDPGRLRRFWGILGILEVGFEVQGEKTKHPPVAKLAEACQRFGIEHEKRGC